MKRQNWLLSVAILLLATVLLTGCVAGLSGKSQELQIREFLKQVEIARKTLDAQALANSFTYPIIGENNKVVYKDEEELKVEIERGFAARGDTTIEDFKFDLTEAKIITDRNGKSAAIKKATIMIKIRLKNGEPEQMQEIVDFELKKVGKQWKFTGDIYRAFVPRG